jgi:DNA-binding PadR family transcriptional regulator
MSGQADDYAAYIEILGELDKIDRQNPIFKGQIDMRIEGKRFTFFENLESLILDMERQGLIGTVRKDNPLGIIKITDKGKDFLSRQNRL